ncbi:MAG TPA: pantoate--beta-alanine ligase, partial [Nitrospirales bacterium]|nr:pantoate--beta-alanine ligase [Nitrospirales bacterium]
GRRVSDLMQRIRTVNAMRTWSRGLQRKGVTIGLVPTMGALHEGHRSLIRAARLACDAVAVSIFVNPLQFGPLEDFDRYPRSLAQDLRLCQAAGVDTVFLPRAQEMYPPGFETAVSVQRLTRRYEGLSRPGHFGGVTTVVTKLLNIVRPDKAFFGQKDYQQAVVVERLVKDLNLDMEIVMRPTVREPDGLALSSRNRHLSPEERKAATVLYRALAEGRELIRAGERSVKKVEAAVTRLIWAEPLARLDYLAVADPITLDEVRSVRGRVVLLLAVWIGETRLIDNLIVTAR